MKKSFFSVPRTLPLHALTTFLIGVGCVWPLSLSLGLTAPLSLCLTACGAVTLLFALLDCMPRLRALAYPLLLLAIGGSALSLRGQFSAVGAALTLMVHGQPIALAAYSQELSLLLSLVFTGIGASLSRSEQAFFPLALLEIALLFIVSFLGAQIGAASLLPLILALLLSGRAPGVRARRIVPLCAAILAVTALLMPLSAQVSPELNQLAQRVRRMLDDYLFFTDARTTFSLSATGYQPLGVSQLGGPANPEDTPVMQVRTSGRTLLRGTIKNEYDGHAWADSTSGRRYLYVNPRFYALRRDLFDQKRPSDAIRAQLPSGETITVLMRADAASTLYLTQRFSALSGHEIVPYFSPASEVFGTRSLAFGDSYTFTGLRLSGDTPGIREAVLAAAHHSDAYADTVRADYLTLPDGVETGVYALAGQITQDAQTDFDRAAALCAYLRSAYPYTLAQNVPPAGRDFVSWFLLDERQGYCTSFATAMAVMARMVGLPARYIEGYAAVPDSDSVARVTQQQAHAWVEIYFSGFGWLPFDPTPGTNDAGGTLRFAHAFPLADGHADAFPLACAGRIAQPHAIPFARTGQHPHARAGRALRYPDPNPAAKRRRAAARPAPPALAAAASAAPRASGRAEAVSLRPRAGRRAAEKRQRRAAGVVSRRGGRAAVHGHRAPARRGARLVPLARAGRTARRGEADRTGQGALRRAIQRPRTQAHPAGTRAEGLRRAFRANDPAAEAPALRAALHPWDSAVRCLQFRR